MSLWKLNLILVGTLTIAFCCSLSATLAQQADNEPIYLAEPEPEPPARAGRQKKVSEKYKETDQVRIERQIVKMSDDRIVNHGTYTEYYPNGKKYSDGTFNMGVFDGDWTYWFPNGQLCKKVTFVNGKPDGKWEVFNKEGKRTALQIYAKGRRDGTWITYHPDGETPKVQLSYVDGIISGDRITYYENGNKRQLVTIKAGQPNGMTMEWDESGKKVAEVEYKDGKRIGEVKVFD